MVIGALAGPLSSLLFVWLSMQHHSLWALFAAIGLDNIAGGFAGTCLIAYMSSLTSAGFTATQYALFSSLYAIPGRLLAWRSPTPSRAARPVIHCSRSNPLQRRIERAVLHLKDVFPGVTDMLGNSVAVDRAEKQRSEGLPLDVYGNLAAWRHDMGEASVSIHKSGA